MIQVPVSIEMNTAPIYTTNWRKFRLIGGSFSNLAWQVELRRRDAVAPPSNEEEDDSRPVSIQMNAAPRYTTNWRKLWLISLPQKMLAFIGTFEKFFCRHMFWKFPCHIMCSTLCTPENDKRQKNKFLLSPWHFCDMQGSEKKISKSCGPLLHSLRPTDKSTVTAYPS